VALSLPVQAVGQVEVRAASASELDAWDTLVCRFENHRIFHTRGWIRSLEAYGFGTALYLVFRKDSEIVGCLPGLVKHVGPFRLFGSPLPGWQTLSMGPAFDRERLSTAELVTALIPYLEREHRIDHVEMIGAGLDPEVMQAMGFQSKTFNTRRVPLHPSDEAQTLKGFKDSARRNIRRAIRLGLVPRFEVSEAFLPEHFDQLREAWVRGGNVIPFGQQRVVECFRHLHPAGHLASITISLPNDGPCIASGMFTIEGKELTLWMWAHRTAYRWYRATEYMTWLVIQRALAAGCETMDLWGTNDFKAKFGGGIVSTEQRWVRSRYRWLWGLREAASQAFRWQQRTRGQLLLRIKPIETGNRVRPPGELVPLNGGPGPRENGAIHGAGQNGAGHGAGHSHGAEHNGVTHLPR
jgi:Acetyltransferase (GNAT) domain